MIYTTFLTWILWLDWNRQMGFLPLWRRATCSPSFIIPWFCTHTHFNNNTLLFIFIFIIWSTKNKKYFFLWESHLQERKSICKCCLRIIWELHVNGANSLIQSQFLLYPFTVFRHTLSIFSNKIYNIYIYM